MSLSPREWTQWASCTSRRNVAPLRSEVAQYFTQHNSLILRRTFPTASAFCTEGHQECSKKSQSCANRPQCLRGLWKKSFGAYAKVNREPVFSARGPQDSTVCNLSLAPESRALERLQAPSPKVDPACFEKRSPFCACAVVSCGISHTLFSRQAKLSVSCNRLLLHRHGCFPITSATSSSTWPWGTFYFYGSSTCGL